MGNSGKTDWNARWMGRARELAAWSKDPSTKVGCVLVRAQHSVGEGYNGFPHGANDDPSLYLNRVLKYERTVHAEANAVAHAARFGHETLGASLYTTFPICPTCAGLVVQAGIALVYVRLPSCEYCEGRQRAASRFTRVGARHPAPDQVPAHVALPGQHIHNVASNGEQVPVKCGMPNTDAWMERYKVSKQLFQEAGIPVTEL